MKNSKKLDWIILLIFIVVLWFCYPYFPKEPEKPIIMDEPEIMTRQERAERMCEDPDPFLTVDDCVRYVMERE